MTEIKDEEQKLLNQAILNLNREITNMNSNYVVDFLLLHSTKEDDNELPALPPPPKAPPNTPKLTSISKLRSQTSSISISKLRSQTSSTANSRLNINTTSDTHYPFRIPSAIRNDISNIHLSPLETPMGDGQQESNFEDKDWDYLDGLNVDHILDEVDKREQDLGMRIIDLADSEDDNQLPSSRAPVPIHIQVAAQKIQQIQNQTYDDDQNKAVRFHRIQTKVYQLDGLLNHREWSLQPLSMYMIDEEDDDTEVDHEYYDKPAQLTFDDFSGGSSISVSMLPSLSMRPRRSNSSVDVKRRKISVSRFRAIMKKSTKQYDVEEIVYDLQDEEGQISLNDIATYHKRVSTLEELQIGDIFAESDPGLYD